MACFGPQRAVWAAQRAIWGDLGGLWRLGCWPRWLKMACLELKTPLLGHFWAVSRGFRPMHRTSWLLRMAQNGLFGPFRASDLLSGVVLGLECGYSGWFGRSLASWMLAQMAQNGLFGPQMAQIWLFWGDFKGPWPLKCRWIGPWMARCGSQRRFQPLGGLFQAISEVLDVGLGARCSDIQPLKHPLLGHFGPLSPGFGPLSRCFVAEELFHGP